MWASKQACQQIIESIWTDGRKTESMDGLMQKVVICGQKLIVWNKKSFGNVSYKLRQAQNRMQRVVKDDLICANQEKYYNKRKEVQFGWKKKNSCGVRDPKLCG